MRHPNVTLKLLGAVSIWLSITQGALSLDCGDFRIRSERFVPTAEIAFVGTPIAARHLGEHEGLDYFVVTYRVEEALRGTSKAEVKVGHLTWFDGGATPEGTERKLKSYSQKALIFTEAHDLSAQPDFIRDLGKDQPIGFVGPCTGMVPASSAGIYRDLVERLRRERQ